MPGNDALAFTTAVNTLAAAMARCLDDSELATAHAEELLQSLKLSVELGLDVSTANEQGDTAVVNFGSRAQK